MAKTITYSEDVKGWTSFHSFSPDKMVGLNNKFYSFNNGDLFEHHDENAPRNTYYGNHHNSSVTITQNTEPSTVKILKAVSLEGNNEWSVNIEAYVSGNEDTTYGHIDNTEFVQKEGFWFAYARRKEDQYDLDASSAYGLGNIKSVETDSVVISNLHDSLSINDTIVNSNMETVGVIIDIISRGNDVILILDKVENVSNGSFIMGLKNSRVEGSPLRGYAFKYTLTNDGKKRSELFSVGSEIIKSYM